MAQSVEPTHEGSPVAFMHLHALGGRMDQALARYARLEEVLLKELGSTMARKALPRLSSADVSVTRLSTSDLIESARGSNAAAIEARTRPNL